MLCTRSRKKTLSPNSQLKHGFTPEPEEEIISETHSTSQLTAIKKLILTKFKEITKTQLDEKFKSYQVLSIQNTVNIQEPKSVLVYRNHKYTNFQCSSIEIVYLITKSKFKRRGYAKILMDFFTKLHCYKHICLAAVTTDYNSVDLVKIYHKMGFNTVNNTNSQLKTITDRMLELNGSNVQLMIKPPSLPQLTSSVKRLQTPENGLTEPISIKLLRNPKKAKHHYADTPMVTPKLNSKIKTARTLFTDNISSPDQSEDDESEIDDIKCKMTYDDLIFRSESWSENKKRTMINVLDGHFDFHDDLTYLSANPETSDSFKKHLKSSLADEPEMKKCSYESETFKKKSANAESVLLSAFWDQNYGMRLRCMRCGSLLNKCMEGFQNAHRIP